MLLLTALLTNSSSQPTANQSCGETKNGRFSATAAFILAVELPDEDFSDPVQRGPAAAEFSVLTPPAEARA